MNKLIIIAATAILLTACSGHKLEQAKLHELAATGLSEQLYKAYIDEAGKEYNEGDYSSADRYSEKAISAARGDVVEPELIPDYELESSSLIDLINARRDLIQARNNYSGNKQMHQVVKAQVAFDCWLEELEENLQPDHIAACRERFLHHMKLYEKFSKPVRVSKKIPVEVVAKTKQWTINFVTGRAFVSKLGRRIIGKASAYAKALKSKKFLIYIRGYTDTTGSKSYNIKLSQDRAYSAEAFVKRAQIPTKYIILESYGETNQAIPTGNGVLNEQNRRVTITVVPK